jgi:hypothetical protein
MRSGVKPGWPGFRFVSFARPENPGPRDAHDDGFLVMRDERPPRASELRFFAAAILAFGLAFGLTQ